MKELAIKIDHISKEYRLGTIGGGTLRGDLQSWWARIRGKEDPNSKIGESANSKIGERFWALKNVSFDVQKGEAIGIIGHNGAGKSTLLKLLSRVTAPTQGTISYSGRVASMLEVGTGFHPELTGRENVYMNGTILGMTKTEIDKKFDEIVEFAEMEQFIDTPVKRYSSGMYVKLAFSVAAHLDSEIMVMDEVLAVGDMKFQQKCLGRMSEAATGEGRTVLYVSHNMNTIRQLCKRCIVLDHGKILFDGDTEKAISLYMENSRDMTLVNECNQERTYGDIDRHIHIDRVTFIEKDDSPIYSSGERIKVKIEFTADRDMEQMAFRIALQTLDKIRVGLTTTKPCISVKKGNNSVILELPHGWLAPGKYGSYLVAYSVNEFGTDCIHDRVENAIVFEKILDTDAMNHLSWKHDTWGYMMIPELRLLEN